MTFFLVNNAISLSPGFPIYETEVDIVVLEISKGWSDRQSNRCPGARGHDSLSPRQNKGSRPPRLLTELPC